MNLTSTGLHLCTFRLGNLYLGIDVLDVQEVLRHPDITRVPHSDAAVCGLIILRSQIATTIDLRGRLDVEARDADVTPIHVVVRAAGEAISILVDKIGDVIEVDPGTFEPPPETMDGVAKDLILGAYKLENELLLILDVAKTVTLRNAVEEVAAS